MKKYSLILALGAVLVFAFSDGVFVSAGTKKSGDAKKKTVVTQKVQSKSKTAATSKTATSKTTTTKTEKSTEIKQLPATPLQTPSKSPATGEEINWQVLSNGGTAGTSANFGVNGTVSQTAVGPGTSTNFGVNSGFWPGAGGGGTCCSNGIAGDADDGGDVNIGDAIFIVKYAFEEGSPTPPCCGQADADGGGDVNIGDAIYIVKFAFEEGAPFPLCSAANPECL
ncbi:MAG: hypothetical protein IIB00_09750 [candidate division Zixibacteria bacterium]|nr:hypothetical protein [candidate division Zixibacteria bacterium]